MRVPLCVGYICSAALLPGHGPPIFGSKNDTLSISSSPPREKTPEPLSEPLPARALPTRSLLVIPSPTTIETKTRTPKLPPEAFELQPPPSIDSSQDCNLFSKFTLFPSLPIELRLMIWSHSVPRVIYQPTKARSSTTFVDKLKRISCSNDDLRALLAKLNVLTHTVDIPSFNLLHFCVAEKIRKAKDEFSRWMETVDTIALSINMGEYVEMLANGVQRSRLIRDAVNCIIRLVPANIRGLLIILGYDASGRIGKQVRLSEVDAGDPQLKPLQETISEAVSKGLLLQRFAVKYKANYAAG